ncbi:Ras GTPase-activating-like protein rng2 [Pseudocercospora fuligena]|uniref:Ras GTPase-activating-like protein rng2 n=1 Tax=Pseudocercospora fuligena TaxID=685502 RepID=A0A8H6RCP2_9PEZI|nr:Ras GTPase-activating-like protein rng2 [Pseudocercospora fuligena]
MPSYPALSSPTSPPHNRFRDHSPTKSSPLRHTVSTRSNNSDTDRSNILGRQGTLSSNASSGYSLGGLSGYDSTSSNDPFLTRTPTSAKRERSESPVKKNAAFAKWEQREQAEQESKQLQRSPSKMDVTPKRVRDDDWRKGIGRSESRSVLKPVAENASPPRSLREPPVSNGFSHIRTESKENIRERPRSRDGDISPAPSPTKSPGHSRGYSEADISLRPASPDLKPPHSPTFANKNSIASLSRSDSMRASTKPRSRGHVRFNTVDVVPPQLDGEDIGALQKSSTPQLRHLSKMAASHESTEYLSVHSPDEQVAGLMGRRKLQRSGSVRPSAQKQSSFASQYSSTKWMDTQRKHLQAYEYLCHIGEARAWIEDVLEPEKLPPIVQLEEHLRDGVTLAEVVVRLAPKLPIEQQKALGNKRIWRGSPLTYRHTDNTALFFRLLAEIELPELFRFELIDLYEKKNIPKVIYCIHAVSWLLFRKGITDFRIGNLVGQLQFEEHELEETQKGIDRSGVQMPNFGGMREAMQVEEEPPPPEPTPEEQLAEQEDILIDLQTQIRGALVRIRLGSVMQDLWDAEEHVANLQAVARGGFAREVFDFRYGMYLHAKALQAASRGFLVRKRMNRKREAWTENKDAVVKVQSLWRGRKERAQTKVIKTELRATRHGLKDFQAAIRGALGRWRAGDLWHETRDEKTEAAVSEFQAAARGALERLRVGGVMNQLWDAEDAIAQLQGLARGSQARRQKATQHAAAKAQAVELVSLQAAARAMIQRRQQANEHGQRKFEEPSIIQAQSVARGLLERLRQARTKGALQGREAGIVKFQTLLRAQAARSMHMDVKEELQAQDDNVKSFQALLRGQAARSLHQDILEALQAQSEGIKALQSCARAMLQRRSIGEKLAALEEQESRLTNVQAMARAYIERQRIFDQLVEMEKEEASIIDLQSLARAMLERARIGELLAEVEEHEAAIEELQSAARAFCVRKKFADKRKHYRENMQKVIKLQSFVRAKQQGESYKSLVNGKNPPLPVVRRHLHLLTDSNLDYEGEHESERLRRQVVESVRRNELVESYVEGLDVKIALLVKNKITLDEVVKHQKHFGGSASQLLRSGTNLAHPSGLDLKALNKNSRKKLSSYEELFFLIQTQPQYLARAFGVLTSRGLPEKDSKNYERLMLTLFGYAQKSREEYFFMKILAASTQQTISHCSSIEDFMRQQNGTFQQRLILNYVRNPRERAWLKTLLGSMVRNGICAQDHLDLESDPLQIYRAILNNEELSTGQPSQRPRDLPREIVIRQEDVRPRYVQHLEDLRDLGDGFFLSFEESMQRMPYGLRYLATEQHRALCAQFPREDPGHLAMLVGTWLWKSYILPAMREPEMWGVVDRGLSPVHKRNLAQVILVVGQICSAGRLFAAENLYLQPLNNWVTESLDRWQDCLQNLFDLPSPEEHYDADQFSDLYATTKPTLYIKLVDIFALHSLIADNISAIAQSRDDPIKALLSDLGTAKSNESDLGSATNGNEITLTLKSRFTVEEDPNAEARQRFTATKRLVLYIIRVQSGTNLMEILLRPITHEDADRWISLVQEELAEKESSHSRPGHRRTPSAFDPRGSMRSTRAQSVYSEAPSALSEDRRDLLDLQGMTYAELKSTALENILKLESPHVAPQFRVSRHNNYQEILNALAGDIRQKHRRRLERQREVESTRATLSQLDSKAQFLEDQLQSYNDYIEQCLHTLANKKTGKHKFVMPFTKQWSHERELERAGRQPKFGSYKYSARQLADKGVLLSWQGYSPEHWGNLNVVISSDEVGVFHLEASSGSMMLPGASANLLLDDLLQAQYDNKASISVFEESNGAAKLAVNLLLHLVFKKFYRDE